MKKKLALACSLIPFLSGLRGMDASRRFMLLGVLVVLAVGIGFVGRWASTPTYVTLFHDLELKEVGTVGEALAKANVQYRLGASGTEVVPTFQALMTPLKPGTA